ncbi:MAG: hypothetical protein Q4E69_02690 [Bacilli bacterium]|nr:hypothetical protein [Bacilli bacterium]
MYYSNKKTHSSIDEIKLIDIDGFLMKSKKGYKVKGEVINNIKVVNTKLANFPIEYELMKKYDKLCEKLVDLLADDDDSGDSYREALNQIERFKLELKNRYLAYVDKKMAQNMNTILKEMKLKAEGKLLEMQINYYKNEMENGKSR